MTYPSISLLWNAKAYLHWETIFENPLTQICPPYSYLMILLGYLYFKMYNYVRNCPLKLSTFNNSPNCGYNIYNLKYSSKVLINCFKKQFRDIYSKINKLYKLGNVFNFIARPFPHCHIRQPFCHYLSIIV